MKKVLSIVAVAALSAAFVSCGPSKEELEAREKAKADSIAAVAQAQADSLAKVAEAEAAAAQAQADAAKADSARVADSLAAAKPGKKH
jgi:regulator of protease activity HflC (stomatin/prohibitin superfamily)